MLRVERNEVFFLNAKSTIKTRCRKRIRQVTSRTFKISVYVDLYLAIYNPFMMIAPKRTLFDSGP
jgi:hypothetical protein